VSARLPSRLLVSALIRRAQAAGGFATVIRHGEDNGGVILIQGIEKGTFSGLFERMYDLDGKSSLVRCGPPAGSDAAVVADYLERRRSSDPDLWIIELDIADAERFADETIHNG
jgi:hypothetical protein